MTASKIHNGFGLNCLSIFPAKNFDKTQFRSVLNFSFLCVCVCVCVCVCFNAFNVVERKLHQLLRGVMPQVFITFENRRILMYCSLGRESMVVIIVDRNCFVLSRSLPSFYLRRTFGVICVILGC